MQKSLKKQLKIVVIGGANNASLSIVQSLGKTHHIDMVGCEHHFNKSFHSKFVGKKLKISDPQKDLGRCINEIATIINEGSYDYVIPTNDRFALILTSPMMTKSIKDTVVLMEGYEKLLIAMDKAKVIELAQSVGCPVPPNTLLTDTKVMNRIDAVSEEISYPVVVKPRLSWLIHDESLHSSTIEYVTSKSELKSAYHKIHEVIPFPIIQGKIVGAGWGIELLAKDGNVLAAFSHKRLREANPTGSYSCAVESIPLDETYFAYVCEMVEKLNWTGVCMFEFKDDDEDGIPKLMEINARFWGSMPVAMRSGVDFPDLLIRMAEGENVQTNFEYKAGVKCRWILSDFIHMFRVIGGRPKGWVGYYPKRFKTVLEVFKFTSYGSYNNELTDPMPGFLEFFVEIFTKLKKKLP